ncbi:energy transducer TonB [Chryseobacterium chendengshani]|uniref:energy transducer TonB n=1 Tax=Chryseobacterium sp. LJ668 TaxID=2864040 RepID=UPI00215D93B1|nr:energy transducer TonB [Chryseobacterium sp. LJ668]
MKSLLLCLFCFVFSICYSQQTEEFKQVKNYYNQHRSMLNTEFKKKFDAETDNASKISIKNDFVFFMKKMDSIENTALVGALLKVKNTEDLNNLNLQKNMKPSADQSKIYPFTDKTADYPGGINALRTEVAQLFYSDAVNSDINPVKTNVAFVVEKNGTISNVKAEGDNFIFNRQAEIALYSVSGIFSPAIINGDPVRCRFKLPLTLNIE